MAKKSNWRNRYWRLIHREMMPKERFTKHTWNRIENFIRDVVEGERVRCEKEHDKEIRSRLSKVSWIKLLDSVVRDGGNCWSKNPVLNWGGAGETLEYFIYDALGVRKGQMKEKYEEIEKEAYKLQGAT